MCYLAFGRGVRSDAAQWIETHIPPDRRIGLSALYYGDWASCPPLDEYSRAVVVLPVVKGYDASDYIDRDLDYIVLSDLILQDVEPDSSVAAFCASLQAGPTYKLEQTFAPVFGGFRLCERLGWELPYDWLYTRPTFYVYARQKEMSH
jgi:hypothetical protein